MSKQATIKRWYARQLFIPGLEAPIHAPQSDRLKHLPVVPQGDSILAGLARLPLPPIDLVAEALGTTRGDEGRFCALWAIHLAADSHTQTPTGERFERASNEEAGRYAPHVPAWFNSRSAAGGATKLTQLGFNRIMYGAGALECFKGYFDFKLHLLTNDAKKFGGYRFIAPGDRVLDFYETEARELRHDGLREFFLRNAASARRDPDELRRRPRPAHHRRLARVTYGFNRSLVQGALGGRRAGYLNVSVQTDGREHLCQVLFGDAVPNEPRVAVVMEADGWLHLRPDTGGWKLTDAGAVQVSTLASAGIPEPTHHVDELLIVNTPLERREGGVAVRIPPTVFRPMGGAATGRPRRSSEGSKAGRARSLVSRELLKREVEEVI